jgi:ABC-type phosphate transport system substrate-binding protein
MTNEAVTKGQAMKKKTVAAVVGLVVALAIPASASAATTLIGSGSIGAEPVLRPLFKAYEKVSKGKVKFLYTANGGNAGVKDVQEGRSQFAGQARPPLPADAGTIYVKLYLDALCMFVHPSNHLTTISKQQTKDIFTSTITNWGDIPGSGKTSTISAYGRDTNGGAYTFFQAAILDGQPQGPSVNPLYGDGMVPNAVKRDPNGIGYASIVRKGPGIKALALNGIGCSKKNVKKQTYGMTRFIWMVLPADNPNPLVQRFTDWVRRSPAAGVIIDKAGGVPAFNRRAKK